MKLKLMLIIFSWREITTREKEQHTVSECCTCTNLEASANFSSVIVYSVHTPDALQSCFSSSSSACVMHMWSTVVLQIRCIMNYYGITGSHPVCTLMQSSHENVISPVMGEKFVSHRGLEKQLTFNETWWKRRERATGEPINFSNSVDQIVTQISITLWKMQNT